MKRQALALLLVAACVAPPPPMKPEGPRGGERPIEAGARIAGARIAEALVRVRLSALDRRDEVRVSGTPRGTVTFDRLGDGVRSSEGTRGSRFVLHADPGEWLGVAGRQYSGALVIEPHGAGGLRVENHLELETYLHGVVPAELVLWSAEPAEIAAQAIAARTYALRRLHGEEGRGGAEFLWDDTRDQVYPGRPQLADTPAGQRVAGRLEHALAATRGQVLCESDGALYDVRFHAVCGGHTASPARVFPRESHTEAGAVACAPCAELGALELARGEDDPRPGKVRWSWTASDKDLSRLAESFGLGRRVLAVRVTERDPYGRWLGVEVEGDLRRRTMSLSRLRDALGAAHLRSGQILRTWPADGVVRSGGLFFEGLGWGHGVGLCQNGCHGYAQLGWSAERILQHYCPDAVIVRLESSPGASYR